MARAAVAALGDEAEGVLAQFTEGYDVALRTRPAELGLEVALYRPAAAGRHGRLGRPRLERLREKTARGPATRRHWIRLSQLPPP